ncbi:hypothetical protein BC828DRAFT_407661 [Blastocladiella britannica]|nr:hypothetical protein BC828DRAFT_407661 [Blastocladiella britannica]
MSLDDPISKIGLFIGLALFHVGCLAACYKYKYRQIKESVARRMQEQPPLDVNAPPLYTTSPRTGQETVVASTPREEHARVPIPSPVALASPAAELPSGPTETITAPAP